MGFRELRAVFQSRDQTQALSLTKSLMLCADTGQAGLEQCPITAQGGTAGSARALERSSAGNYST